MYQALAGTLRYRAGCGVTWQCVGCCLPSVVWVHLRVEIEEVLLLYFKDILSSKLNGKFNKHLQPSSTVPEWRAKDNDLRLLLTNGRIIK